MNCESILTITDFFDSLRNGLSASDSPFQSINNNITEFVQNFKTASGDVTLHTDALIAGVGIKYMEELL